MVKQVVGYDRSFIDASVESEYLRSKYKSDDYQLAFITGNHYVNYLELQ